MLYIILGTKGQFIKMLPLMKLFDKKKIKYKYIHTGQHQGIISENAQLFGIRKPDLFLSSKLKDLSNFFDLLFWAPSVFINGLKLPLSEKDIVFIHGNTESSILSALIAKIKKAKIYHIESGLQTGMLFTPFPEEIISRLVTGLSDVSFCVNNNDAKNVPKNKKIIITNGNTVFDTVNLALNIKTPKENLIKKKYVIFSIHCKENLMLKQNLGIIMWALKQILQKNLTVVWPIHKNTEFSLQKKGLWKTIEKWQKIYSLQTSYLYNYVDFMHLVKNSLYVATDGGGLQEETYFLNKPCLVLSTGSGRKYVLRQTGFLSFLKKSRINFFFKNFRKFKRKDPINNSPTLEIYKYLKG